MEQERRKVKIRIQISGEPRKRNLRVYEIDERGNDNTVGTMAQIIKRQLNRENRGPRVTKVHMYSHGYDLLPEDDPISNFGPFPLPKGDWLEAHPERVSGVYADDRGQRYTMEDEAQDTRAERRYYPEEILHPYTLEGDKENKAPFGAPDPRPSRAEPMPQARRDAMNRERDDRRADESGVFDARRGLRA